MSLPEGFPAGVAAFACDLDGTLIHRGGALGPRTLAAVERARGAGIPVIVATGRMFRSVRRYLAAAGIAEPVVCYQGAAVVDPTTGTFLLHERIALEVAHEAVAALEESGHSPNVYVDDELFVAEHTRYSRAYADFQNLPVTEVGPLLGWLDRPPTKLVAVGEPAELPKLQAELRERFAGRLFVTRSLPHLLELGNPRVSKGTGLAYVTGLLGIAVEQVVAFGDAENDIELLAEAGFGIAIETADESVLAVADATCAGPEVEGVAAVIEAALDLLA